MLGVFRKVQLFSSYRPLKRTSFSPPLSSPPHPKKWPAKEPRIGCCGLRQKPFSLPCLCVKILWANLTVDFYWWKETYSPTSRSSDRTGYAPPHLTDMHFLMDNAVKGLLEPLNRALGPSALHAVIIFIFGGKGVDSKGL